jgi:hypothetical protein
MLNILKVAQRRAASRPALHVRRNQSTQEYLRHSDRIREVEFPVDSEDKGVVIEDLIEREGDTFKVRFLFPQIPPFLYSFILLLRQNSVLG